jgi:hypothetical protein
MPWRELTIAFRARVTWIQAALSALLVGHGFVLAVDLYSAGSRSVEGNVLMGRQFDPLLGIVRPTLGGMYLAVSLLGAIVAVRPIAIERERRTLEPLVLLVGSPVRIIGSAFATGAVAVGLQLVAPVALLCVWTAVGGHLGLLETAVALSAYALYAVMVAALGTASAAWSRSLAQAATVAILAITASWAIDAAEGFAALAWLGRAVDWSVTTHLQAMERGTLRLGDVIWIGAASAVLVTIGVIGIRYDLSRRTRVLYLIVVCFLGAAALSAASVVQRGFDVTELRRSSLPPAVNAALRQIRHPIGLDVYLDRDDARRRQVEADALAKLRLARPDLDVQMPLDRSSASLAADRDAAYGRLVVRVGNRARTTYSTSRRELTTVIFELAGAALPEWSQPEYPGYPLVVEGTRRTMLLLFAYVIVPVVFAVGGWIATRTKRTP